MRFRFVFSFALMPLSLLAASSPNKSYTPEQTAAESKRVNEFFDQTFDAFLARHPQFASQLGQKDRLRELGKTSPMRRTRPISPSRSRVWRS